MEVHWLISYLKIFLFVWVDQIHDDDGIEDIGVQGEELENGFQKGGYSVASAIN